ncbi:Crp/Fnr family transcriptional regulator [Acidisoma cellulosilytica]|uniref:Crp/Fnr family transcriptional regulator n=1 Tax=Acidisoma cellulosilyticum TaxID=2802395 RepID=A0A963Z3Q0_9PROT|nr:Crp/Fnr family transcriptional regulator [Acidisoma cellulosilyticum]MCB8882193.1 Crp/Fnr family transcriptional regulator [Acidisoma cellulosilyticum]
MAPFQCGTICNRLLAALPPDSLSRVVAKLSHFILTTKQIVQRADAPIEAVYFPASGMISLVSNLRDGMQAEVAVVGTEGMLGTSVISGAETSFVEAIVQMPGTALRMASIDFKREIETNAPFRNIILRYNEALQAQFMQTAACNGRHGLGQRLGRWLLIAHDRADRAELLVTQEFIAMMLGVHRPSITIAAGNLQRAGLIRSSGGRITVTDRAGLEAASCECYGAVQKRFANLLGS